MATLKDCPDDQLFRKSEIVRTWQKSGLVPHGRSVWDERVKAGLAPQPIFPLGRHMPLWRAGDLRAYLAKLNGAQEELHEAAPA